MRLLATVVRRIRPREMPSAAAWRRRAEDRTTVANVRLPSSSMLRDREGGGAEPALEGLAE